MAILRYCLEKQLDVEIKMAGKAREKFQQIDAEGSTMVSPTPKVKLLLCAYYRNDFLITFFV